LGGLEVDDQLKCRRLLDRKIGGVGPFQDLVHVRGGATRRPRPRVMRSPLVRPIKKAAEQEAKLAYLRHVLMENRHSLVVETSVTKATGTAEREAALAMVEAIPGPQ
jgi:hypothetical protein